MGYFVSERSCWRIFLPVALPPGNTLSNALFSGRCLLHSNCQMLLYWMLISRVLPCYRIILLLNLPEYFVAPYKNLIEVYCKRPQTFDNIQSPGRVGFPGHLIDSFFSKFLFSFQLSIWKARRIPIITRVISPTAYNKYFLIFLKNWIIGLLVSDIEG